MAGKVPLHRPRSFERGAEGHHSERGDKLGKRASYDGDTGKSGYYTHCLNLSVQTKKIAH